MEWLNRNEMKRAAHCPRPFKSGTPTVTSNIIFLLIDTEYKLSRKTILREIGLPEHKVNSPGYYSSLFSTLRINNVLVYDREMGYVKGQRYLQYLEFCMREMEQLGIIENNEELYAKIQNEVLTLND